MRTKFWLITCVLLGLWLIGTAALAKPLFKKQYAAYYNVPPPKCTTCHIAPPKLNAYGKALKAQLKGAKSLTPAMFKATDSLAPK